MNGRYSHARSSTAIIALRQPTARDLRLLMAISKTITNLERVGDEAEKIAKRTRRLIDEPYAGALDRSTLTLEAGLAARLLGRALDAFESLDPVMAAEVLKEDQAVDDEFHRFAAQVTAFMASDPPAIASAMDLLFVAKALERIGDHAKNVAEFVIYIVRGADVRHSSQANVDQQASGQS